MALVEIIRKKQASTRKNTTTPVEQPTGEVVVKKTRVSRKKVVSVEKNPESIDPESIVPEAFNVGVWVTFNQDIDMHYECGSIATARREGVPAKITYTGSTNPLAKTTITQFSLMIPGYGNSRSANVAYRSNYLTIISIKDAKDRLELLRAKHEKDYTSLYESAIKLFSSENDYVPIKNRKDYNFSRFMLATNSNYVGLGKIKPGKDGEWEFTCLDNHKYQNAGCCALTKSTQDIITWIPKTWLHYYGYTRKDLELWIDFCSRLEIGFEAKVIKEVRMDQIFGAGFGYQAIPNGISKTTKNLFFLPRTEEAYEVVIKGSTRMKSYMYFILLRYMYNSFYYTLPFIAMQLKMKLKDHASFWECLLLAHNHYSATPTGGYYNYYNYYCLTGVNAGRVVLPTKNNTAKAVLSRFSTTGVNDMNGSFEYQTNVNTHEITKLIQSGTNEQIIKFIENQRKR